MVIAERRRLAYAAFRPRPLDAFGRIVGDGILLAEIVEQRRERGEPVPDRAAAKPAVRELVAPGDDVRARHSSNFLRPGDAGESHEVADRILVGTLCARVAEIGEPLDLRRYVRQAVELGGGEQPTGGGDFYRKLLAHDRGRTMLPGGTPASLCVRRYSAASASRSPPVGPQTMRRC